MGGNIGQPLLCQADDMEPEDWAVLELSSFQLMTMDRSPYIAVVTNLAPNHLDVHKDMAEYVAAKENIFRYQRPRRHRRVQSGQRHHPSAGRAGCGGLSASSAGGPSRKRACSPGEEILCRHNGQEHRIMTTADIRLPGVHNVENTWRRLAAVEGLVPDGIIRDFARTFNGVEHRIELVRTYHGCGTITTPSPPAPPAPLPGCAPSRSRSFLIAGGYDKHIPFDVLGPEIVEHVKLLVLCGATAGRSVPPWSRLPAIAPTTRKFWR